jgi:ribosomal protein S18 acetylase RimI-like enzyme
MAAQAMTNFRIEPATAERWDDVVRVMGTRGDPARCWCQYFHLRNAGWRATGAAERRSSLSEQVCGGGRPPGVLAYAGDEVAGWCQVGPKDSYARLATAQVARPPQGGQDPDGLWSITCFVVPVGHRGRGAASALLTGAVEHARSAGAVAAEGYPVDTEGERRSSSSLYHGTVTMFAAAGFELVRRPSAARAVMRLSLR